MRPLLPVLVLFLAGCATAGTRPAPVAEPASDLLIRGGRILDGTGSPWFRADVLVRGDRIAAVGLLPGAQARDTIDATGLIVSPGWIDMLGHSEYPLIADGRALSKITQGITSEITGEVTSVVPMNERTMRELGSRTRERVGWTDLDGYFAQLEAGGTAINLGTFVTVGSVRRAVLGDANRAPTPAELEVMKQHVALAMQQGALGLSSGLIYAPASYASTEEVLELARVAAAYGGGYASHIRSEGARLLEAIEEAIAIGEQAGTWVQIHHLKSSGQANWGKMPLAVAAIEAARARGVDVSADQYPYHASSTGLDNIIPIWAHAGGTDSLVARLQDPAVRAQLRAEIMGPQDSVELIGESAGGPTGVMLAGFGTDSLRRYNGMFLGDVATQRGQHPIDALFDLLVADSAGTQAIYFSMAEEDVEYAMKQPWVSVGIDAGARDTVLTSHPHPRAFGSFPRILCRYVRERRVITLPDAMRKFSALPAARVGLSERGVIRTGMFADLTIFDEQTVCDRAAFDKPVQTSVGIRHVLVNGTPVLRDGKPTGAKPGRGLRRAVPARAR
jgi:dihydroorotase/N-acyl-D-amino-acid deacylase